MRRGEIYFIRRRDTIGAETAKARPAVIVSNDALNATSEVLEVVYLTTQPKREMPTHVEINATGCSSTALCEHIDHISVLLVGDYCGTCSDEEMEDINRGLAMSLGLHDYSYQATENQETEDKPHDAVNHPSHYNTGSIEVIDFIEDAGLGFSLGNAVKYIARAGKKDPSKTAEDLRKAKWYIERELKSLGAE